MFTAKRCPNKIFKTFLFEDIFHLPLVSTTPVVHLELQYLREIFEKICNSPNGILRRLGETDSLKIPEVENLVILSLFKLTCYSNDVVSHMCFLFLNMNTLV
jgi:hypothetical protein